MVLLKRWVSLLVCVVMICTSSVFANGNDIEGGIENMDSIAEFIAMLRQDVPYDELSCYWDGETLSVIEDELDAEGILDGRSGEYRYNRLKAKIGMIYSVDKDHLLSDDMIITNDERCFASEGETRFIRITIAEASAEDMLNNHNNLIADQKALPLDFTFKDTLFCESTFMESPRRKVMVGLRFAQLADDGRVIVYEYGGVGNYSDIAVEAKMMAEMTLH